MAVLSLRMNSSDLTFTYGALCKGCSLFFGPRGYESFRAKCATNKT